MLNQKKNAGEKKEWATTHFQPCVVTLSDVVTKGRDMHDVRACEHDRGLARTRVAREGLSRQTSWSSLSR